jgi:hypothetical protein
MGRKVDVDNVSGIELSRAPLDANCAIDPAGAESA